MLNHQVQHPSLDALPVDAGLVVDMTPNVPPDGAIAGLHAILRPSATIHQSTSRCVRPLQFPEQSSRTREPSGAAGVGDSDVVDCSRATAAALSPVDTTARAFGC